MNQILVTDKIYVTPELRKKKKAYKINFIISIILVMMSISFYMYQTYSRNKSADISQDILEWMNVAEEIEDTTTINGNSDVWIISLNGGEISQDAYSSIVAEAIKEENKETSSNLNGTYTASNGKVYNTVGTINIPSINVNFPIISSTSDELLKISVCKFWGNDPNEVGNLCIAGHNYRNSKFFSKVPNLVVGDTIEITDLSKRTLQYSVYDKYTVDPTDVSCTSQLTNGKKEVTLITCTNDSKQRVVIKAREIKN